MFLLELRAFPSAPCLAGKQTWWQLASRCCWNRVRPWHASELVFFLAGLMTYQHPVKHKLKLGGSIQILRDRKLSKRVSLLKELWQLHHVGRAPGGTTIDMNAYCCKDRGRLFPGRDTNVCREVLNLHHSTANQHRKRLIQESLQSLHCDLPDQTPYSPDLDPLTTVYSGRWSNTWGVADSTVMRKWKLLFVNGCECKNPHM